MPADREIAGGAPAGARALKSCRVEDRLRVLLHPEEIRALQDLVALAVLRVHGREVSMVTSRLPVCGFAGIEVEASRESY
jgi:hypothetical protein